MSNSVSHVLYVDDDELSLMVMQLLLVEHMHVPHVVTFNNSQHFLERVLALPDRPEVILLDIHVRPYSGFEMLKLLRENGFAEEPIIALTASVMNEEIAQLKSAGFDGVIAKPVQMELFPEMWRRILNKEQVWAIA